MKGLHAWRLPNRLRSDQAFAAACASSDGTIREFRVGRRFTFGLSLLAAVVLSGCFGANHVAPYPSEWPQAKTLAQDTCPMIAGRYLNAGTPGEGLAASMQFFCNNPSLPASMRRPSWSCGYGLASNLVDDPVFLSARAIEIRQPDPGTVSIAVPDDPSIQPRILMRSHLDFGCGASGLTISRTGSAMNAGSTLVGVIALTGGVASSLRSFRPLADRSLIMDVTNEQFFFHVFVGGTVKGQGFVRWERDTGDTKPAE